MATKSIQFTIDVKGNSTGKTFKGAFKAKERLSMRDRLDIDTARRNLLGAGKEEEAGVTARSVASILSQLSVRLTQTPDWWLTSNNGLDLEDENVVVAVYEAAIKVETDAQAALLEEAKAEVATMKKAAKAE
jgi:hypothetical protein